MQCKRLKMPRLPLVKTLRREVLEFNVKYTAIGNATFGAREGAHDDLVLAVAIAVYGLDRGNECSVQPLRL
jgi:septum formation topological specificity factor MinE